MLQSGINGYFITRLRTLMLPSSSTPSLRVYRVEAYDTEVDIMGIDAVAGLSSDDEEGAGSPPVVPLLHLTATIEVESQGEPTGCAPSPASHLSFRLSLGLRTALIADFATRLSS